MYVIETDLGRFEGTDEKDAKKKLRAAKRVADKQTSVDFANRTQATLEAKAKGFRTLSDFVDGKTGNHPWIIEPSDTLFTSYVRVDPNNDRRTFIRMDVECNVYDTAPEIELYAYRVVAFSLFCDGSVGLVWTQDIDRDVDTLYPFAVGYCEDQTSMEYLPEKITLQWAKGQQEPVLV